MKMSRGPFFVCEKYDLHQGKKSGEVTLPPPTLKKKKKNVPLTPLVVLSVRYICTSDIVVTNF